MALRRSCTLAAALVIAVAACRTGGVTETAEPNPLPPPQPVTTGEVVTAGEQTVEQYRQALEIRSLEALKVLYEQSLDLVVIHQGKILRGWDAVDAHLTELVERTEKITVRVSDVAVTSLGEDGSQVTASLYRRISDGVTTVEEDGRLTLTLRRSGDRWAIVGEHFSYSTLASEQR